MIGSTTGDLRPPGPLHHVCLKVEDLEAAATKLAEVHGAGPFFALKPEFERLEGPCEPTRLEYTVAFGLLCGNFIELKAPGPTEPPALADALSQAPVNHLAYLTSDVAAETDRVQAVGGEWIVTAAYGPFELAYYRLPVVGLMEVLLDSDALRGIPPAITAETERWDGREPLRFDQPW